MYGSEARFRQLGYGPIQQERHIEKVLRRANIWKHFSDKEKFPQGLNTRCWNLSGGETRSVGTARALLKNPSILLLDEPTEGLDAENEEKVMRNIVDERPVGQTVLAIAHRLSSIKNADQIIFLGKDGSIAEQGTWEELLKIKDGKFAKFESVQNLKRPSTTKKQHEEDVYDDAVDRTENSESDADSVSTEEMLVMSHNMTTTEEMNMLDPLAKAVDAVEGLRLYVKASNMPRQVLTMLSEACDVVKEQQRVQDSISSWGGLERKTPYHHLRSSSRLHVSSMKKKLLLRQHSREKTLSNPLQSTTNIHVSKRSGKTTTGNKKGLRMASVF